MKKILFCISFSMLMACEKYPSPGTQILNRLDFYVYGGNQWTEAGEYLADSIGVIINMEALVPAGNRQFIMEIEVSKGGGSVDQLIVHADKKGMMKTRWKMGDDSNEQILNVKIYDEERFFSGEAKISATSYFMNKLNLVSKGILVGIQDMVYDTINQRSMLLSGGNLFISTEKFYRWEYRDFPFGTHLHDLEINSRGEIIAAGWNGYLYQSSDWGITWKELDRPIPGNPYAYQLTVTKDDYIWANKWEKGIYCSKDNGLTWQKDTCGLENQEELGPVYLSNDSVHMALSHHNVKIHKTSDGGLTWVPVNTPRYVLSMFVTDDNAIIAQNQEGFHLFKSVDGGETYRQVFSTTVAFNTSSRHLYNQYGDNYYVLAPGGGVWKTKDFEQFELLFEFEIQHNLFIDHRGIVYACGYDYANALSEPTLILPQ